MTDLTPEKRAELRRQWVDSTAASVTIRGLLDALDAKDAEAAHLKHLLGLDDVPEERPSYAPGGYAHELDRVADLLNDIDAAPEADDEDQSVFGGVNVLASNARELVKMAFPKEPR